MESSEPVVKRLVQFISSRDEQPTSLLAVCPNSRAVTRAALLAAKEANAPLLFAATLNQVDVDGGYTGMTPRKLVSFIETEAEAIDHTGLILPCLDHGGPWLKDTHTMNGLSYDETMAAVKRSLEACLDAGYLLLHIDPTVDRRLPADEPIPIDLVVQRTLELIEHSETYRREHNYPPISYEVGTEEVHGGLANMESFEAFLEGLDEGLKTRNLEDAWPCFVVGKVGTDLHTSYFEPDVARELTRRVKPYGALIKGHYTDSVENPEDYPLSGMGGANVGPEYTEEEYAALMDLVALEEKVGQKSGLKQALENAVVDSGRWEKWRQPEEEGKSFDQLDTHRQEWLVRTGSRYVWTKPAVEQARRKLYDNLAPYRDADSYVLWRIKTSIMKYFHAFNLIDFTDTLHEHIPGMRRSIDRT
jgi:tagatose-1,6-bisphosphate aldolase non-catalytic subunit AgaZ/GatZ